MAIEKLAYQMAQAELIQVSKVALQAAEFFAQGKTAEAIEFVETASQGTQRAELILSLTQDYIQKLAEAGVKQPPVTRPEETSPIISSEAAVPAVSEEAEVIQTEEKPAQLIALVPKEQVIMIKGKKQTLTPQEYKFIEILLQHQGKWVDKKNALKYALGEGWQAGNYPNFISGVRTKLGDSSKSPRFLFKRSEGAQILDFSLTLTEGQEPEGMVVDFTEIQDKVAYALFTLTNEGLFAYPANRDIAESVFGASLSQIKDVKKRSLKVTQLTSHVGEENAAIIKDRVSAVFHTPPDVLPTRMRKFMQWLKTQPAFSNLTEDEIVQIITRDIGYESIIKQKPDNPPTISSLPETLPKPSKDATAIQLLDNENAIIVDGQKVRLSQKQYRFVEYLLNAKGQWVGKERVLAYVFGKNWPSKNWSVAISDLRARLGETARREKHILSQKEGRGNKVLAFMIPNNDGVEPSQANEEKAETVVFSSSILTEPEVCYLAQLLTNSNQALQGSSLITQDDWEKIKKITEKANVQNSNINKVDIEKVHAKLIAFMKDSGSVFTDNLSNQDALDLLVILSALTPSQVNELFATAKPRLARQ